MSTETILEHRNKLLQVNSEVLNYHAMFKALNRRWSGAITAGMIETGRMSPDAVKLFQPLVEDMQGTKEKYEKAQSRLLDGILVEMAKKIVFEITDTAKFAINILKRNLFERTADVGYLATDSEIVKYIRNHTGLETPRDADREMIQNRLAKYQYEYTVYDEILILDTRGQVLANLDKNNPVSFSRDPLLAEALAIDLHGAGDHDLFVETFRATDLRPGKDEVLIYSQKIEDPDSGAPLGVLCLCFDFEDEMRRVFKDLKEGNSNMVTAVLDARGRVISSSAPEILPEDQRLGIRGDLDLFFMKINNQTYLATAAATDGYQGFFGLPWFGLAMIRCRSAFQAEGKNGALSSINAAEENIEKLSSELAAIKKESDELLNDMKIDSLNGEVQAAKFNAKSFVAVLHFVKMIGEDLGKLFSSAISNLQNTVASSLFKEVEFRAFQGNNIMDRNLYERANDVCWWALTPLFQHLMVKHLDQELDASDRNALTRNLQYINDLYTPYLRLLLVDPQGVVVAVSDPPEELTEKLVEEDLPKGQSFVGASVDFELVQQALQLDSGKDYCVSDFAPTSLYGGRHTYIYSTAVRAPDNPDKTVGAIQIVFDSEPQFLAMLMDTLPRDSSKEIVPGAFGVFVNRDKQIISSTDDQFPVGSRLPVEDRFFQYANGERDSSLVEMNAQMYVMGLQVSGGYREYKREDGYRNDIICMIFVPL